jgi:hypothetical protein
MNTDDQGEQKRPLTKGDATARWSGFSPRQRRTGVPLEYQESEMAKQPLLRNLNVDRKMKPYVERMRLRLKDHRTSDSQVKMLMENSRNDMKKILLKKKIPEQAAERAIGKAISIALDYQLEPLRRERCFSDKKAAERDRKHLIKRLDDLMYALSKLPPFGKRALDKITAEQDWRHFDTEVFTELIHALMQALSKFQFSSASHARAAMNEARLPGSKHPRVMAIDRTARPAILDLWDTIPATTRVQVEAHLRRLSRGKSALQFLRHLKTGLAKFNPRSKKGRSPATMRVFAHRIAGIWIGLGLRVGRAATEYDSVFQRFCRHALAAVGEHSGVSRRQVRNLQNKIANSVGYDFPNRNRHTPHTPD